MQKHETKSFDQLPTDALSAAQPFSEPLDPSSLLPGLKPVLEILLESPEKVDLVLCRDTLVHKDVREVQHIQKLCRENAVRFRSVPGTVLDALCRRKHGGGVVAHQGIVCRLAATAYKTLPDIFQELSSAPLPLILALDQIQDPGNLGTLARTFYTLGGAGLLLPEHKSAGLGPQARRSAAGALDKLPTARVTNLGHALDECEEYGLALYAAVGPSPKAVSAFDTPLDLPAVLVLGNEERGIRPDILKRCSTLLTIPQARTFNSFNVAQAGAILLGLTAARTLSQR